MIPFDCLLMRFTKPDFIRNYIIRYNSNHIAINILLAVNKCSTEKYSLLRKEELMGRPLYKLITYGGGSTEV